MNIDLNDQTDGHTHKHYNHDEIIEQLNMVINDSEKMAQEVLEHLDIVLDKLEFLSESKELNKDIEAIKNNIFNTMSSMQSQDFHVQRIQRVICELNPNNTNTSTAKHIAGDNDTDDLVDDDEIAKLIAQMGNN